MAEKLKWGILGTGWIATIFAQDVPASRTGELSAVASRNEARAAAFAREFAISRAYGSYEDLLADPDVDAIYIALPNHLHREWTIRCAEAGKHILCEKPLATNYAEAMLMVEAARRHDVFLMEAFMYRFHPQASAVCKLIRDGAIGDLRLIEASFCGAMGPNYENFRLQNGAAGGAIMDLGTYGTSMARLLAGAALGQYVVEPTEIKAMAHIGEISRVDEWSGAVLRFPQDIIALLNCGNQVTTDEVVRVWGTAGHIILPDPWLAGKHSSPGRILLHRKGQVEPEEIVLQADAPLYALEVDAVAEHLAQRQASQMTWADSLANMQALDAWRREVGLVFDLERPEALSVPYTGRPLARRPDSQMKYGRVAGVDKPVSRVVFGSMMLNIERLPYSFAMLDYFFENGGNCIDTAWLYGSGKCEKAVGEWLARRGVREQIVLIGKGACTTSCTPELVNKELFESLDRLQTDYVDIYFMHRDNPHIPAGEFVECLNELLRAGRIRAFGGSNWSTERIAEANAYAAAHNLVGFAASSPQFSLAVWNEPTWNDCLTASNMPARCWYEHSGVALFAWSSQAGGFFAGRFKPEDRDNPAAAQMARVWFNEGNFQRLARAENLAARKGVSAMQIALAYVLCQPLEIYALIGPATIEEMGTSLLALQVELTQQELRYLNLEEN